MSSTTQTTETRRAIQTDETTRHATPVPHRIQPESTPVPVLFSPTLLQQVQAERFAIEPPSQLQFTTPATAKVEYVFD